MTHLFKTSRRLFTPQLLFNRVPDQIACILTPVASFQLSPSLLQFLYRETSRFYCSYGMLQGMGEMHLSHAPTGHHNASSASVVRPNMLKRGVSDQSSSSQDFKRQRLHGVSDLPNASDIESYKRQHEVSALGENVPAPFITFDAAGIPSEILKELQNAGFLSPTPIQAQSWPIAFQSRDIVAIAKTGSGKTLGYLLPAFLHLRRRQNNSHRGPTVLVLAPTRELATQIQEEAVKFGRSSRITSTCIYGGAPKGPQLRDLERGADIVVATPGRLNDFLEVRKISLQQVSFLVLDEADRMLDMGFEPQIRKIVNEIPSRRQTLMYTATWPKEVRKIASDLLVNPVQVNIGNIDELSANKSITQCVEFVAASEKHRRLEQILRSQEPGSKILVFCSTKKMCDQLTRILSRQFGAAAIHGDKSQSERDWVLTQFKTGRSPVLVATDVAARGLDIKDIRIVINFDFPTGIEDYVHRIGRTGRAGATGLAYTFFSDHDAKYAQDLVKVLEVTGQRVPPELRDIAARSGYNRGRGGRWDSGGHGGRGGRGDGGRGYGSGRGEVFGARGGGWGMVGGRSERQDRVYDRFGGRGRFDRDASDRYDTFPGKYDRDSRERHQKGGHNRYFDDGAETGRGSFQKFDERLRGRSYSRSYSRSPSRSRSHGRSYSRSRSRSLSYDRYDGKVVVHKGSSSADVRSNSPSKIESMERHGLPVRNGPLSRFSAA
ncbi:ATP-dependent RNA helicase-like protein DB10 isoform X2 [Cryptomeria japonica]|uniref:ATP-dependent RNA helicase-like protein DB10 isoform X2 n=1 Tax=Cryptomeria japonica TaxID=3369 RepID=UPI0027DA4CAA|nr:ATP-dependent RNA helicase-like protein DB10 isoform X2 [Cryptomeria japonica]